MTIIEMIQSAAALGVLGMLWKIARELGCIKANLKQALAVQDDHEHRLRRLEGTE